MPRSPAQRRWFPGYTVAGVASVAYIATAPGQTFIISQINGPLRETFGISELMLNSSYTVATIVASLPLVLMGSLTDRLGPRRTLALVALLFGIGCLVMSGAPNFAVVVLAFFLLRFFGQGALSMVSQHAVAMWFHRRLGTINGLKQVVIFGAWIVFPQIAVRLIDGVGWRWTYAIFALFIWIAVIPAALILVRNKPEDLGLCLDGDPPEEAESESDESHTTTMTPEPAFTLKQAMRSRAYWTIVAVMLPAPMIGTAILFDMQPILGQYGMDKADAANVVSVWPATMATMALPSGWLTDRVRASILMTMGIAIIALSVLAFWLARTPIAAMSAMAVFSVGQSTIASCMSATLARYFGRSGHGAIRSSVTRLGVIATGVGPLITALSVALTGSYNAAMVVFLMICLPGLALGLGLKAPVVEH